MSTYRERRERRAEDLRRQAATRDARSDAARAKGDAISGMIPFGQPILVGHHSEGRHRRDLARIDRAFGETVENARDAEERRRKADEIERQAERAIYDDDPDAVERLEAKLADLERERNERKAANTAYRAAHRDELRGMTAYERSQAVPFPSYSLTNLSGNITRTRQRLERLRRPDTGRTLVTRFDGKCEDCGAELPKGTTVRYFKRERVIRCAPQCPEEAA